MSTGLNCQIVEYTPGQWYYVLENWDAPKMAWDWREYATATGPFVSEDTAHDHLSDNHANPGGYSRICFVPEAAPDEVMNDLVAHAESPVSRSRPYSRFGW